MKCLSFVVAFGIFVAAVNAAPTNTDKEAAEVQEMSDVAKFLLDNEVDAQKLGKILGGFLQHPYRPYNTARALQDEKNAELQGLRMKFKRFFNKIKKFFKRHGNAEMQQDVDNIMAAIEGLPEEAQVQILGTLIGVGAPLLLNHLLG